MSNERDVVRLWSRLMRFFTTGILFLLGVASCDSSAPTMGPEAPSVRRAELKPAKTWSMDGVPVGAGYVRVVLGHPFSNPIDINSRGNFVGIAQARVGIRNVPVVWTRSLERIELAGNQGEAMAINDGGIIVGHFDGRPAWIRRGRRLKPIGSLGGYTVPRGVNNKSWVVGWSNLPSDDQRHAFVWTEQRGMRDVGTLGGKESVANAINDKGVIVGVADRSDGTRSAFYSEEGGGLVDIGLLLGCVAHAGPCSEATDVNSSGQIVGSYRDLSGNDRPFLWSAPHGRIDIPLQRGVAFGINDFGVLLGAYPGPSGPRLFVWTLASGVLDVDDICDIGVPCFYNVSFDINNEGTIVGNRNSGGFGTKGVVWQLRQP